MYSIKDIMIVDYNNLYGLITAPYYKFANNTFLTFPNFVTVVVSFTDYVRFIIDELHSSDPYDITFFSEDKKLYDIACELEPVLSVLEKATPDILDTSKDTKSRLEDYLDNISTNTKIDYNILELYYSYLVTIAQLQIVYCYTILAKNRNTMSSPARPLRILPSIGKTLNVFNEDHAKTDLQFIVEIRDAEYDANLASSYSIIDNYPLYSFFRDTIKVEIIKDNVKKEIIPNITSNILSYVEELPNNVKNNTLEVLKYACIVLQVAEKVKTDKVMYVLDNTI